jgi:hypothetical protein
MKGSYSLLRVKGRFKKISLKDFYLECFLSYNFNSLFILNYDNFLIENFYYLNSKFSDES